MWIEAVVVVICLIILILLLSNKEKSQTQIGGGGESRRAVPDYYLVLSNTCPACMKQRSLFMPPNNQVIDYHARPKGLDSYTDSALNSIKSVPSWIYPKLKKIEVGVKSKAEVEKLLH